MSQKLLLPFTICKVVAGYRVEPYRVHWGYHHYGIDYKAAGNPDVLASGNGTVAMAGYDNAVGNTVCIVYHDVYSHETGTSHDLVARYMHLASISVMEGQSVRTGDKIGMEGKTGSGKWAEHLHVELDTDIAWPNYSPQVAGSNFIKKTPAGYPDTTVNPSDFFYRGENQVIVNGGSAGWTSPADWTLPLVGDETCLSLKNRISILTREKADLEEKLAEAKAEIATLKAIRK